MRACRDEFVADCRPASNGYAVVSCGRARFLATRDELVAFALKLADVAEALGTCGDVPEAGQ